MKPRPCPIDTCTSTGPAPTGICHDHTADFPADLPGQIVYAMHRLLFATPAEASLFLGQPFMVVERELRTIAGLKSPMAKTAKLVLERAAQHLLPTVWLGDDLCCARCATLVRKVNKTSPIEYFVGGPDDWTWTETAPVCRPYADGTSHVFTWTALDRPRHPGNQWVGTCAHCPTNARSTDDPQGGTPPTIAYRTPEREAWVSTCPPCVHPTSTKARA